MCLASDCQRLEDVKGNEHSGPQLSRACPGIPRAWTGSRHLWGRWGGSREFGGCRDSGKGCSLGGRDAQLKPTWLLCTPAVGIHGADWRLSAWNWVGGAKVRLRCGPGNGWEHVGLSGGHNCGDRVNEVGVLEAGQGRSSKDQGRSGDL